MKYKILLSKDQDYAVYELAPNPHYQNDSGIYDDYQYEYLEECVFSGSISDCEAYIRLKQNEDVIF